MRANGGPDLLRMRAAVCALAGIVSARHCVRLLTTAIRWRATSGGCVRRRSSCSVRPALLTGVLLDAAPQRTVLATMASPVTMS